MLKLLSTGTSVKTRHETQKCTGVRLVVGQQQVTQQYAETTGDMSCCRKSHCHLTSAVQ